jgi:hypothetical protein
MGIAFAAYNITCSDFSFSFLLPFWCFGWMIASWTYPKKDRVKMEEHRLKILVYIYIYICPCFGRTCTPNVQIWRFFFHLRIRVCMDLTTPWKTSPVLLLLHSHFLLLAWQQVLFFSSPFDARKTFRESRSAGLLYFSFLKDVVVVVVDVWLTGWISLLPK